MLACEDRESFLLLHADKKTIAMTFRWWPCFKTDDKCVHQFAETAVLFADTQAQIHSEQGNYRESEDAKRRAQNAKP